MGTDEAHVQKAYRELDDSDQTIVIPHDVEHIPLVPDSIHGIKILLDVGIACPPTGFDHSSPHLHSHKDIGVQFCELLNGLFREYSHWHPILVAKIHINIEISKFISDFSNTGKED
jgi:hypothetical protein